MPGHVELMKLIIGYTLVGAFVFTVIITCLSLIGLVKFTSQGQQVKLFSILIVELAVLGMGTFAGLLELNPSQAAAKIREPLRREVSAQRQVANSAIKSLESATLEGLQPEARTAARELIERAEEAGIDARINSGYRSPVDQLKLYAQGRSAPGPRVTNARVSIHSTGLAFDVFVYRAGKLDFGDTAEYRRLGEIGRQLGLVWGGDSPNFSDYPHFQTRDAEAAKEVLERSLGLGASAAD